LRGREREASEEYTSAAEPQREIPIFQGDSWTHLSIADVIRLGRQEQPSQSLGQHVDELFRDGEHPQNLEAGVVARDSEYLTSGEKAELEKLRASVQRHKENLSEKLDKDEVKSALRAMLREAGIKVQSEDNNPPSNAEQWLVVSDGSIRPTQGLEYYKESEIVSRKLRIGMKGHGSDRPEYHEIIKVLEVARQKFDLMANRYTGLHVHVGLDKGRIPFGTVQRLAVLLTAFEHIINQAQ
jgi:hypothetical protein